MRSKLVHGGATKTPDVGEAANDLIEWLRRALLALITTHSPLLVSRVVSLLLVG